MDSGSEIDFNDLPEASDLDSELSGDEGAPNSRARAKRSTAGQASRDSSPSRATDKSSGRRSPSPLSSSADDVKDLADPSSTSTSAEVSRRSPSPAVEEEEQPTSRGRARSSSESSVEGGGEELEADEEAGQDKSSATQSEEIADAIANAESGSEDELRPEEEEEQVGRAASQPKVSSEDVEERDRRSLTPEPSSASPSPSREAETASPDEADVGQEEAEASDSRDESPEPEPERKASHGSSSFDEAEDRRASSMSPEPTEAITAPASYNSSKPEAGDLTPSSQKGDITRIYTDKLVNEKVEPSFADKVVRSKPTGGDITQIYTASLQAQKEQQSPRLERARGGKPVKDITQLYTANLSKPESTTPEMASPNRPRRNDNITKMYTNAFDAAKNNFNGKPRDEITNPKKHNMATTADKEGIRDAYSQVMADNNEIEWAVFKFDESNRLVVSGTGAEFQQFKSQFGPDDRGFGYIKIQTGDEMSKRSRFVLVTWVGANISVMKKAKMSTDKLIVKEIIQNLSVELQTENSHELNYDHLKSEVDKAGGARYGTGVREK